MPARNTKLLGTKHYPYMVRGRVEVAVFTCPRCNDILKFRGSTAYRKRCPTCSTVLYVFLRVCVGRNEIGRAPGTAYGTSRRPIDTILPVVLTPIAHDDPLNRLPTNTANYVRTQRALNQLVKPLEGEPGALVPTTARRMLKYQPAGEEVDQFVAELGELGIEGTIESLPHVGLGRWKTGELAHRLVDLDELRERGDRLRVERIEDSDLVDRNSKSE
jgi:hypothetical protein